MLSVLICFQHTTTIIRVNPSKNNSTESQNLPAIPQITPTINSNFPSTAKAQPPKRVYPLYLWPRSKVWMRALKASIQTAATKVTNIGGGETLFGGVFLPAANSYLYIYLLSLQSPICIIFEQHIQHRRDRYRKYHPNSSKKITANQRCT
jgi:hypothetical protein